MKDELKLFHDVQLIIQSNGGPWLTARIIVYRAGIKKLENTEKKKEKEKSHRLINAEIIDS